ncbi:transcription termination factor MTERF8, chloroplastic-like isoform X1 [Lolium perenne]|uniref:transcription termination factor MTERF8, chloroplastic-like isoform X1 n=1 Tax=Lolium perenne TaxID=4522 RepID=UPI0021F64E00|nr:transcription termination factor MTERF4, chloroplastic-like isoform X1 [Lolium perenne]
MLRLRSCILTRLLSSPSCASPITPLHRLLSAATADPSPAFAVEQYLVDTCGLTRPQALKASAQLAHLKSPSKPDAVLAFLADLGLSSADVAAAVAGDPQLLCADVDKTLAPVVAGLTGHGLSRTEVARLVSLGRTIFRCRSIVSNLPYYLSLFGSYENLQQLLKQRPELLGCSLEKVVKPNVAFLRECGLGDCILSTPRILSTNPERLPAMVACAEGLGVPRRSPMFRHVLYAVAIVGEDKIAAKVDYLKKTFRWSDAQVGIVACRNPQVLSRSKGTLQRLSEFFISEMGLEPADIAHRSVVLTYSLDSRLKPRYYAVKFLKENGLVKCFPSYFTIFNMIDKVFVERYICPHKEAAPHLYQDYVAACKGEVSTRFLSA